MITPFLFAMAWKSAVLCTAGLGLSWLVRRHSAAVQVTVLRLTAVLVLSLPLLALVLPALRIEAGTPQVVPALPVALPLAADSLPVVAPQAAPAFVFDWKLAVAAVYGLGVVLALVRLLADLAALSWLSARARPVEDPVWRNAPPCGRAGSSAPAGFAARRRPLELGSQAGDRAQSGRARPSAGR